MLYNCTTNEEHLALTVFIFFVVCRLCNGKWLKRLGNLCSYLSCVGVTEKIYSNMWLLLMFAKFGAGQGWVALGCELLSTNSMLELGNKLC